MLPVPRRLVLHLHPVAITPPAPRRMGRSSAEPFRARALSRLTTPLFLLAAAAITTYAQADMLCLLTCCWVAWQESGRYKIRNAPVASQASPRALLTRPPPRRPALLLLSYAWGDMQHALDVTAHVRWGDVVLTAGAGQASTRQHRAPPRRLFARIAKQVEPRALLPRSPPRCSIPASSARDDIKRLLTDCGSAR
jgi:hypothetical protein